MTIDYNLRLEDMFSLAEGVKKIPIEIKHIGKHEGKKIDKEEGREDEDEETEDEEETEEKVELTATEDIFLAGEIITCNMDQHEALELILNQASQKKQE